MPSENWHRMGEQGNVEALAEPASGGEARLLGGRDYEERRRSFGARAAPRLRHRAGARAHDDRVRDRAVRAVADAAQQRAGRDAGRGDEDVLARDEIVGREHALGVEPGVDELLPLLVVPRPELALDRRRRRTSAPRPRSRPRACRRSRRACRRPSRPAPRRSPARRRRRGSGAPSRRPRAARRSAPRAGRARARRREISRGDTPFALATAFDVLGRRRVDVDHVDRPPGRRRSSPCRRPRRGRTSCRARRRAITAIAFGWPSAVSRVPSSGSTATSTSGPGAVADLLAVVEHRRLVLLALADHDDAVHRDGVEHRAHRVDRRLVGGAPCRRGRPSGRRPCAAASVTRTSSSARLRSGALAGR